MSFRFLRHLYTVILLTQSQFLSASEPQKIDAKGTLHATQLDQDGRLVVLSVQGTVTRNGEVIARPHAILSRFRTDGTLDKSFGSKGGFEPLLSSLSDKYSSAAWQFVQDDDGSIVIAAIITRQATGEGTEDNLESSREYEEIFSDIGGMYNECNGDLTQLPEEKAEEFYYKFDQLLDLFLIEVIKIEQNNKLNTSYLYVAKLSSDGRIDRSFGKGRKGRALFRLNTPHTDRDARTLDLG